MAADRSWERVAAQIGRTTGLAFEPVGYETVAGGCINAAAVLSGADGRRFFVKLNDAKHLEMFRAEADGLKELARAGAVRVPQPICTGSTGRQAFLALEYVALRPASRRTSQRLGEALARQHRVTRAQFGWHRDNTIGATAQINTWHDDWVAFFRRERLGMQLALAAQHGYRGRLQTLGAQLLALLPAFFSTYRPLASLLHGDLWSGNYAATADEEPVIFDPAVYYGDRETDLAMTELFGGFGEAFYRAYQAAWPLDAGYRVRKHLYNLYHVLNHLNLFGGGYAGQAERLMRSLLAEVR